MESSKYFDIIGIGIGPFNLGLAALCEPIAELKCLFIDSKKYFHWHPGLLLPNARLQVPFYSDLVTLADPCSAFSYMAFLKAKGRMFRFAINENYFIRRTEYSEYCQWVADQIRSIQFNCSCEAIYLAKDDQYYKVITNRESYFAKQIVIGTGTVPYLPSFAQRIRHSLLLHSGSYLYQKNKLLEQGSITIVGSGQSAAEIAYDLINCFEGKLFWFTRSAGFFPMDYSKLSLEKSTPDYIDHFFSLQENVRADILKQQDNLYKGINASLISDIYEALFDKQTKFHLHPNCELKSISESFNLKFEHTELKRHFNFQTDAVILCTGYKQPDYPFLEPIRKHLEWNEKSFNAHRNYSIDRNNSIFIQNAEQNTHGFNVADLSLGPYRNAVILNTILGYERYSIETGSCFQRFGLPV